MRFRQSPAPWKTGIPHCSPREKACGSGSSSHQSAPRLSIGAMSRYANDGNASANAYDQLEAPLPTYEEVVGTETPHHPRVGFKSDVLLPPSSADQGQSSVDCGGGGGGAPNRGDSEGVRRTATCKPNKTGTILVLLGMIVIPMCGMIIILQIKACATEQAQLQQSVDKVNASYSDCSDELASLQQNLDSNEIIIRDLRYKVEELTKQKDALKLIAFDKSSKAKPSTLNSVEN